MAIHGVLAPISAACSCPRSLLCFNPSSGQSSCSSDRRFSSLSSSASLGRSGTRFLRGGHDGKLGRLSNNWSFNENVELRVFVCSAQESGTLSKEVEEADDSSVRSKGVATIYGDDSIYDERKVIGQDEPEHSVVRGRGESEDASATPPRPKRIDFDYGFQAKFLRTGPTVPRNVFRLAFENFGREWRELRRTYLRDLTTINPFEVEGGVLGLVGAYTGRGFILFVRGIDKLLTIAGLEESKPVLQDEDEERDELRAQLKKLVLSNDKVWERERSRPAVEAPWWILGPYYVLCYMLDVIFNNRPIQRFWFLETVARMPYFSYISMLHFYETLGWWRTGAEVRKVHFAEEWNEMHHLKIMESLGGDLEWGDRFFGQHAAFFYYWILNGMFLVSPSVAYNFSELIEAHAVDTYGEFADANEELLKTLPPPPVAVAYYESDDLYMYDEFQTSHLPEERRPKMNNLHDVFLAISGDESEHVKTMVACQQLDKPVVSPHGMVNMRK